MWSVCFSIIDAIVTHPYKGAIARLKKEFIKLLQITHLLTLVEAYIFLLAFLHMSNIWRSIVSLLSKWTRIIFPFLLLP